ncbi:MAG TPA: hypothetical protein VM888_13690 [Chitinophagaceae bacterium]|nr:hypothetical protein [Chitinophagaceae bacterium]
MRKEISFFVSENNQLTKKVIDYFIQFEFKLVEHNGNCLKFSHGSTLFDTWKTNPLKWGSEISVFITDNKIDADFCVDSDAQMNTKEEEAVWETFIENFQTYMTKETDINSKIESTITENKKSRKSYVTWVVLGALTGGLLSVVYNKLTNSHSMFSLSIIPIMATTLLTWRINYKKTKNAL